MKNLNILFLSIARLLFKFYFIPIEIISRLILSFVFNLREINSLSYSSTLRSRRISVPFVSIGPTISKPTHDACFDTDATKREILGTRWKAGGTRETRVERRTDHREYFIRSPFDSDANPRTIFSLEYIW